MSQREVKIRKLITRLTKESIEMGYNVQQTDHLELNGEEIFELFKKGTMKDKELIEKFVQ